MRLGCTFRFQGRGTRWEWLICPPDLNPIEQVFSKLKRLLRKANERSLEATWSRIGKLLDHFPPNECFNYITGAGYTST